MLVNSTSSFDDSLLYYCSSSRIIIFISAGLTAAKAILVLPLYMFILYLAFQHWRQQRSFKTANHCDLFTYHLSLIELFWAPGCTFYLCGVHSKNLAMILLGMSGFSFIFLAEVLFHTLTCVERYLAVVHPIIYLKLKTARGIRIRTIAISCVWLLCLGFIILHADASATYITTVLLFILVFAIIVVTFCSISVLCILMHPGPGEGGGRKGRVNQSKQRAFHTIATILGVQGLWFLGILLSNCFSKSSLLNSDVRCAFLAGASWLSLPSSLTAPLLYLNRYRKLSCC